MCRIRETIIALIAGLSIGATANTASAFETSVTYSQRTATGSFLFGFVPETFPEEVHAVVNLPGIGTSPGIFDSGDLTVFDLRLGSLDLGEDDIESFELEIGIQPRTGEFGVKLLNYTTNPVSVIDDFDTVLATNVIASHNSFSLTITGCDETQQPGSDPSCNGVPFTHFWSMSDQVIDGSDPVINIKPGSDTNAINTCSGGSTPVAIFGSNIMEVETLDLDQLILASANVRTVGKSDRTQCSISDIGAPGGNIDFFDSYDDFPDGNLDVVCHFVTHELMADNSSFAALTMVGCDDPNDTNGCVLEDLGYFEAAAMDSVTIVKDCN